MTHPQKKWLFNSIGIILSVSFLYLCFHSMDPTTLAKVFLIPHPLLLLLVVALNFVFIGLHAAIWEMLLAPIGAIPFWTLFDLMHVGYMANNLLPLKAGEFFRASFVSKKWSLPYTQVLTTIGLERYFAGFGLMLIFLPVACFLKLPIWIQSSAVVMTLVLVGVQVSLIFLWKKKPNLEKWKTRHPVIYKPIEFLFHVSEGSKILRSLPAFLSMIFLSLLAWLLQAGMLKLVEQAFDIHLGWLPTLFTIIAINLATAIPSGPANIGTFEYGAVLGFTAMGLDKAAALGIGFYFHLLQTLPVILVGLFYYFRWGLRFKEMEKLAEEST